MYRLTFIGSITYPQIDGVALQTGSAIRVVEHWISYYMY